MRIKKGYLDQLDLGIDKESGQKNILVHSASEYASLPEAQQRHAWATILVASEILDTTVQGIYYRIYHKGLPTKVFKQDGDHKGLTFVKPYGWVADKKARRAADQRRISMTLRRVLGSFTWLPRGQGKESPR
jgi:hypothetical protein